jgi:soluble lytic murein transglycosylase
VKTVVSLFALALVVFAAREVPAQEPQGAGAQVESTAPAAVNEAAPSTVEGPAPSTVVEAAVALLPTAHPALPGRVGEFWFLPESFAAAGRPETPAQKLARGAKLIDSGDFAAGLPLVTSADVSGSPLASYARYYRAVALAGLNRMPDAIAYLQGLEADATAGASGYLFGEAVPLRRAELEVARQNADKALDMLDGLSKQRGLTSPEDVWLRIGRAAEAAGDRDKAIHAYRKVYYESPLSLQALDAQYLLEHLDTSSLAERFTLELARAERIFNARRWAQARAGFEPLANLASGDDKELTALRLAECDYYLDRFRASRDALRPYLKSAARKAEARFFSLTATRALGDNDTYIVEARALVDEFPDSTWAAETLNNLASHYIILDDDAAADEVFRELWRRFPGGRYAERAAWKIGWWAYKNGRFADAAQAFDSGAAAFPRSDNRPAWLYWSGRAHDQTGEPALANERYRLEVADYENSYYGRLASKLLDARDATGVKERENITIAPVTGPALIPTATVIRELVGVEMYDAALKELQYAQRAWGDTPAIEATIAWIRHEQAQHETAPERFDHLRGAITIMKRAYPQYLAAGGEGLPPAVLEVIYPLDYWPLIEKYSTANGLDPYLMAALIAQESTFTADVRSGANAYGLMQLLPATGRQYAQRLRIRPFSTASLTRPETNIQLGMAYFKDLVERFGGAYFALASYNAGESRVSQWLSERPGMPQDEFIDDIPYPETQNYVKRILGTAEDYRRLYGGGLLEPGSSLKKAPPTRTIRPTTAKPAKKAPVSKASAKKPKTSSRTTKTR